MNENPQRRNWNAQRLADRIAAADAGKAFQIVVKGNCKVCKRRSAAVPATKTQVLNWFTSRDTTGFKVYEQRMLTTGVHRACQQVQDDKARAKKIAKAQPKVKVAPVVEDIDPAKVQRVIARRKAGKAA